MRSEFTDSANETRAEYLGCVVQRVDALERREARECALLEPLRFSRADAKATAGLRSRVRRLAAATKAKLNHLAFSDRQLFERAVNLL